MSVSRSKKKRTKKKQIDTKSLLAAFMLALAVAAAVLWVGELFRTDTSGSLEPPEGFTRREVDLIAKTVYGEALVTHSETEMAAVAWCILNRVDAEGYGCGGSIEDVVTFPSQFHGYDEDHPVLPEIEKIVISVLESWSLEKQGVKDVGRILPKEYIYFTGDGAHNNFTTERGSKECWDWSLPSPFES